MRLQQAKRKPKTANRTKLVRIVFRVPESFKVALDAHLDRQSYRLKDFGLRAFKSELKRDKRAAA